jgi:hypothetical protein
VAQKFTVIQAVALGEFDGITVPNAYGKFPLIDLDPSEARGHARRQSGGPEAVRLLGPRRVHRGPGERARALHRHAADLGQLGEWKRPRQARHHARQRTAYGEFLGRRFGKKGIIWILGGDRTPTGFEETWRTLARGIAIGVSGKEDYDAFLMSFHPSGGETSSTWFHNDRWLDFNMQQDGHNPPARAKSWEKVKHDYDLLPAKPVIDGEPLYEDHPLAFNSKEFGYSFDAHVRQYAYADTFSGACGHTYGNHAMWQFYAPPGKPINGPLMDWRHAIVRPGATQMQYVRALLESRPYLSRVPDQSIVVDPSGRSRPHQRHSRRRLPVRLQRARDGSSRFGPARFRASG